MQAPRFLLPRELVSSSQQQRRTTSLDAPSDQVAAILPDVVTVLEPESMTISCVNKPCYMSRRRCSDSSTDSLGQASMSSAVSACSSSTTTTTTTTTSRNASPTRRSCLKKSPLLDDDMDLDNSIRSSADKSVRFNDHVEIHNVRVRSYLQRRLNGGRTSTGGGMTPTSLV